MPSDPFHWPSQPPGDCPFEPSDSLAGIRFTGRHAEYTDADTWYPSWASDGHLYSSWTDGTVNGIQCHSFGKEPATGWARIVGDDPMKLEFADASTHPASPAPYGGRYPCAYLVHDGVSYCGTYCLNDGGKGLNWDILGPFVGFRWSVDFGKTWTQTPHTPAAPIFGEPEKRNGKVKFGAPHFVDFGRNMEHSPDGKAYLVGHGAVDPDPAPRDAKLSWITGDQIYLARVTPSVENINDASKYEFFAGRDRSGEALWDNKLADARPIAEWINNMGCVTITFVAALNKYILCVTDGGNTIGMFNTYLLESDDVCGPWRLVHYWRQFGRQAYFVNIPTKFLSSDGQRGWLCYSANFNHRNKAEWIAPPGSRYAMCLQEFRFAKA
jgi:hypothetical protein